MLCELLFYIWKHFSSVLSKSCVINHAWQIPGWGRRKRIVLFIWGGTEVREALLSVELTVSIFWCTPLSFPSCQTCSVFMPFSTSFSYEMYSTSLCQVPCEISLMHEVQRALKIHLIWYYLGNTNQSFLVLSPFSDSAVRTELWEPNWWGREARGMTNRRTVLLCQPATHSQCGIGRKEQIGIMEKSWTGLVEWE